MNNNALFEELVPENYTAIYARHSKIDEKNNSNQYQIAQCKSIASQLNLIVYKSYEDEGSGFTIPPESRNGFKQLLMDAKEGYFKNLIVWKVDRLWRQSLDYPKTKQLLDSYGVNLIFSDMLEFKHMNPIYKNFMTNMFLSIAELEPNRIREKTVDGRNYKRSLGIVFLKYDSFGYEHNKDKKFIQQKINDAEISKSTETYYIKKPVEAAFINSCFLIYKSTSGIYNEKIKQIKIEMQTIKTKFEGLTLNNFNKTVDSIPDKVEIKPIKTEIKNAKQLFPKFTSKEMQDFIGNCCDHCSNDATLGSMLINHHYCGLNVINHEDNNKLIKYDEKSSTYVLNDKVYNNAVNIDIIVDKNLWFEVAADVINFRRLKPIKMPKTFYENIKCGKCKCVLVLKDTVYTCPICGLEISKQNIKEKVIKQLGQDNYLPISETITNLIIKDINNEIKKLEIEINKQETTCAMLSLEYVKNPLRDIAGYINTESKKSIKLKDAIAELQDIRKAHQESLTKLLFKTKEGADNFEESFNRYFSDKKYNADIFLSNFIKGVVIINDGVKNKYKEL